MTFDFLWFIGQGDSTFFNGSEFILKVLAPYFIQRFILLPLPFYLFLGYNPLPNLILAEIFTNLHSFLVIATNHAGDDLYRFKDHCRARSGTFYLRQVISSANFTCGNDIIDFLQGFLNYQVEHHIFPDLSMLSYQKAQPLVKQLCIKHHIPYIQHNVFYRLKNSSTSWSATPPCASFPSLLKTTTTSSPPDCLLFKSPSSFVSPLLTCGPSPRTRRDSASSSLGRPAVAVWL